MINKPLLIELHFLPSIPYFKTILSFEQIILEQKEHYIKRSFRNRSYIASANGKLRLTIPLERGKNQQKPIREVRISYEENWQMKHWRAIYSAYGNAPFFEYYEEEIRPLYEEKMDFLFDYNLKYLNTIFSILAIRPTIQLSQQFLPFDEPHVEDFRNKINPRITTQQNDATHPKLFYPQVFMEKTGFLPNLSILDLIFCTGPEVLSILQYSKNDF